MVKATKTSLVIPITLSIFLGVAILSAQEGNGRQKIGLPTDELYRQMLRAAEKGEYEKVEKGVQLLKPLIQEINIDLTTNIDTQIEEAISQGDRDKVVLLLQSLIRLSVRELFKECEQPDLSPPQMRQRVKTAYKEYLVLDPYVRRKDFEASQSLLNVFRRANSMAGVNPQVFSEASQAIVNELEKFFFIIDTIPRREKER